MRTWLCRIFGHHWKHTLTVGESREYACDRCPARKVICNRVTLSPEDSKQESDRMRAAARGVMALLDALYDQ